MRGNETYQRCCGFGTGRTGTYSPRASAPGTAPGSLTSGALPGSPPPSEPPRLRAGLAPLHARVRASGSWERQTDLHEQWEQPVAPRAAAATSPTAQRRCGTAPARRRWSPSQWAGLGPGEMPQLPVRCTPLACQRLTPFSRWSAPPQSLLRL